MRPQTELIYSLPYIRLFNKNFSYEDLRLLRKKFEKFEQLYSKYIDRIIKLIEEHSEPWKKEFIPTYLTEKTQPISDPLTLRYEENEKYLLAVLIHELIHNNISKKFKDRNELHRFIQELTREVYSRLDLDLTKEIHELGKRV